MQGRGREMKIEKNGEKEAEGEEKDTHRRVVAWIKSTIFVTSSVVEHARTYFGDFPRTVKHVRRVGRRHCCYRTQHYISLRNARHYRVAAAARASTNTERDSREPPRLPTSIHPLPLVKWRTLTSPIVYLEAAWHWAAGRPIAMSALRKSHDRAGRVFIARDSAIKRAQCAPMRTNAHKYDSDRPRSRAAILPDSLKFIKINLPSISTKL